MDVKQYNKIKLIVEIAETLISILFLFFFVKFGLSKIIENYVSYYLSNSYLLVVAFSGVVLIILGLILSPLNYYSSFYLEHKYNLSNQTFRKWIIEKIKIVVIAIIIGIPIIILFYFLLLKYQNNWWVPFGIGLFFLSVILAKFIPEIIMPLFYKIEVFDDLELKERILSLAKNSGLELVDIYKFNMSKNTKKANAVFTGIGKSKKIILGDTLLDNFTKDEIETIIAHEAGHYKHKHIYKNLLIGTVESFGILFLVSVLYSASIEWFGFTQITQISALPLIVFWASLISVLETPFVNMLSRRFEYQADKYAVSITNKHENFITALNKLALQNLGDKEPNPVIEWYFYSHPSVNKRILYITSLMQSR